MVKIIPFQKNFIINIAPNVLLRITFRPFGADARETLDDKVKFASAAPLSS